MPVASDNSCNDILFSATLKSFSRSGMVKALYMILLDRRCLSECNGDSWRDEYGVTFIIFTIKEMMRLLHLGNKKINKMLKEHNLIYRSHQRLGKPNKI